MSKKVAILTDSNSGITPSMAAEMGISVVPMPFTIDEKVYYEDINLTREEFYQRQAEGAVISTSQPSPKDVAGLWEELLGRYDEVVYIPMSSGMSGSCQTARMLSADFKGRVQVVDNQRISVTMKRSVQDALELAAKGVGAARIRRSSRTEALMPVSISPWTHSNISKRAEG